MIRAHTYSVVLRDPDTGALGVGVQSHWFNVGRIVPWVRPGAGAVATQALAEPMFGPRGLDLMGKGRSASEALEELLAADDGRDTRQVALVDSHGGVAAHTGSRCIAHASHETGDGWSVQANIMRNADVVPAMAEAMRSAGGDTAERIMAVLEAAEATGGDLRGSQSAAMRVSGSGTIPDLDLRVEDHPEPIAELRRVLTVHRAYEHMEAGDNALGAGDSEKAAAEYAAAAEVGGGNAEVVFWQAITMASVGDRDAATEILKQSLGMNPDLEVLLRRLPEPGLFEEGLIESLLEGLAT